MTAYEIAHSDIFKKWFVKRYRAPAFSIEPAKHVNDFWGFTPKNQKLFTYPYCYCGFTPSYGNPSIFRYEDFKNEKPEFRVICEMNPNPTIVFLPYNYKKLEGVNTQDKVEFNGYPTLSWVQDYFNTWLAQNSKTFNLNLAQANYNYDSDVWSKLVNSTTDAIGQIASLNVSRTNQQWCEYCIRFTKIGY